MKLFCKHFRILQNSSRNTKNVDRPLGRVHSPHLGRQNESCEQVHDIMTIKLVCAPHFISSFYKIYSSEFKSFVLCDLISHRTSRFILFHLPYWFGTWVPFTSRRLQAPGVLILHHFCGFGHVSPRTASAPDFHSTIWTLL